jgi:Anti-sigma-K factor rskA
MNSEDRELLTDLTPEELAILEGLDDLLVDPAMYDVAPSDLEDRIMASIAATAVTATTTAAGSTATATATPPTANAAAGAVIDLVSRRNRKRGMAAAAPWLIAAAASIIAIGAVAVRPSGTRSADAQVALAPTDLAPGVEGSVRLRFEASGTRIDLDAPDLPTAPEGFFYQGWVKGDRGLVAVGTFHTARHVILWAGVSLEAYPLLTVTLEPEDGDQTSSGKVVLRAPVGEVSAGRGR